MSQEEADLLDEPADQGSEAQPVTEGVEEPEGVLTPSQATKLRNENRSLRGRLRRSEISQEFGPEVADLIPDALPLNEWADFAAKVKALQGPAGAGEASTDTPSEEKPPATGSTPSPPSEAEKRLAAVSGTSHGTPAVEKMSALDWISLRMKDPGEADRVLRAGGVASAGPPNPQHQQ